jgi:hypothetical protein
MIAQRHQQRNDPKRASAAIVAASAAGVDLICAGARTLEVERDLTARGTMPIAFRRIFRELGERYDCVLLTVRRRSAAAEVLA